MRRVTGDGSIDKRHHLMHREIPATRSRGPPFLMGRLGTKNFGEETKRCKRGRIDISRGSKWRTKVKKVGLPLGHRWTGRVKED